MLDLVVDNRTPVLYNRIMCKGIISTKPYDCYRSEQRVQVIASFDKLNHVIPLYVKIGEAVEKVMSATCISEGDPPVLEFVCVSREEDPQTQFVWKRTFNLLYFKDHLIWVLKALN